MFAIVCKAYRLLCQVGEYLQQPLLLVLRLYFGYSFAKTGWGKLTNIEDTITYFRFVEVPMPEINAYMAGITELVFGVLLLVGLLSRASAVPLIFTMIVAYLTAHAKEVASISDFVAAPPFKHLTASLVILCFGPGVFSADYAIGRWLLRENCKDHDKPHPS